MKKLIPILFALVLLSACQKEPSTTDLDNDFVVFTNYDTATDFSQFSSYYVADSVLLVTAQEEVSYLSATYSTAILEAFISEMDAMGYVSAEKDSADLGLQISYIENSYFLASYTATPYWWWGYPSYWTPSYWGGWGGGWYYPYVIRYRFNVGSLLGELVNLTVDEGTTTDLPVVWNCYLTGLLSGSDELDEDLAVGAIEQAFTQSSYLKQ